MEILLINPRGHRFTKGLGTRLKLPPWGLCAVAALIPDEHTVSIVDEIFDKIDFRRNFDLVGITATDSGVNRGYEIADIFRTKGVPVVMGGIHVSAMPDEALQHADAVVVGEAELIFGKALEDAKNGKMKGIYKADKYLDMIDLPMLRIDLLKHSERYSITQCIQTTRGCPYDCEFCSTTKFWGNKYRLRPVDQVVEDIKNLDTSKLYVFADDNFGVIKKYTDELLEKILPLNIKWVTQVGVLVASRKGFLEKAAKSGCKCLFIGFETINTDTLERSKKTHNNPAEYKKIIEQAHKVGIIILGSFVIGMDDDDPQVFKKMYQFFNEIKIDCVQLNVPYPYVGTQLRERLLEEGRITCNDYDNYMLDGVNFIPKKMTPEELCQGYRWLHRKFASIPGILKRCFRKIIAGQFLNSSLVLTLNLGTRRNYKSMIKAAKDNNPVRYLQQ
jgi:radical SAM superfamily enzyme YgiQ (UPF0313 family)